MQSLQRRRPTVADRYFSYALAGAPAAIGFAMGLLAGGRLGSRQRATFALAALSVGVAASAPFAIDYVKRRVAGPGSRIGSRKRLRSIRDASIPAESDFYEVGDEEDVITF